jgi:hypothetical protein
MTTANNAYPRYSSMTAPKAIGPPRLHLATSNDVVSSEVSYLMILLISCGEQPQPPKKEKPHPHLVGAFITRSTWVC